MGKEGGDGDGVCVSRREHHGNEVDTKSERRHWSWCPLHLCSLLHHPDPVLLRLVARDRGVGKEKQSQTTKVAWRKAPLRTPFRRNRDQSMSRIPSTTRTTFVFSTRRFVMGNSRLEPRSLLTRKSRLQASYPSSVST